MKKIYITPEIEINETIACQMMALSLPTGTGTEGETVDIKEEEDEYSLWDSLEF